MSRRNRPARRPVLRNWVRLEDRINPDYTLSLNGTTLTITADSGDKSLVGQAYFPATDQYSILDSTTTNLFHDNGTGVITGGDGTNQVFLDGSKFDRIVWVLGDQNDQFNLFGSKDKTDVDLGEGNDTVTVAKDGATTAGGKVDGGPGTDTINYTLVNNPVVVNLGDDNLFTTTLTGGQVVPPSGSTATGTGYLIVPGTPGEPLEGGITVGGIPAADVTDSNIRIGAPGSNGPVAVPVGGGEEFSESDLQEIANYLRTQTALSPGTLAEFIAGNGYWDVRSAGFPGGEIRGQLIFTAPPESATGIEGGVVNVENALGGNGNDILIGSEAANVLQGGNGGDDWIFGRGGNDKLFGVAGNNTLVGGFGDDSVTGGTGTDSFEWRVGDGSDQWNGTTGDSSFRVIGDEDGNSFEFFEDSFRVMTPRLGLVTDINHPTIDPLRLTVAAGRGDDTFVVLPDALTEHRFDGGPGANALQVNTDGSETNLVVPPITQSSGTVTSDNREPIVYQRCGPRVKLSLGNLVWLDENNDGLYDPATEAGVAKVPVRLFRDGTLVGTTTSGAKGLYLFTGLDPGDYVVEITPPSGLTSSRGIAGKYEPAPDPDNDVDSDDNGTRAGPVIVALPVTLAFGKEPVVEDGNSNSNLTVDFGLIPVRNTRLFSAIAVGADRGGSGTVRVHDAAGTELYTLTAFPGFTGGVRVVTGDVNGDGTADVIAGTGPGGPTQVRVFDGATKAELFAFSPFEASFLGGVFVAAGDFDGDGRADFAVTPDEGGGPRVRVFRGNGFTQIDDFFGIEDPNFRGGARAAGGDLDGNGIDDLLVAAGFGGGPRLAGFNGATLGANRVKLFPDFFVFELTLRNGVFVASADVNGDGIDDLVNGGGPGGAPRVLVLDTNEIVAGRVAGEIQNPLLNFFAGDTGLRGGVRLGAKDFNGDGVDDFVTGAGPGAAGHVRAFNGANGAELDSFFAFAGFTGGVFVG